MFKHIVFILSLHMSLAELNLPIKSLEDWANDFGRNLYEMSEQATALVELQTDYLLTDTHVQPIRGERLVRNMKHKIESMLKQKAEAVGILVNAAEQAHLDVQEQELSEKDQYSQQLASQTPSYENDLSDGDSINSTEIPKLIDNTYVYPKAKSLNTTQYPLYENAHFYDIDVSLNFSTVHVPTNVYDESKEVIRGVKWSETLDQHFYNNYAKDSTLSWQYFGSSTGFLRTYPGLKWEDRGVDLFDCRTTSWYIQAASSSKDLVLLVDTSGSMMGLRLEIAKATVTKILATLNDDDYFNVIKFSETTEYLDPCFNGTMIQATNDNKNRIIKQLGNLVTRNIANFESSLTEAFKVLAAVNASGECSQCNQAVMLITDGAPHTYEKVFEHYNWPHMSVRVFTFLIGREISEVKPAKWMACANKGYFSHISTLADVHEHVQDYIHVLSRPMVIDRVRRPIWTTIHKDTSHHGDEGTSKFILSIAQPVFDRSNHTVNKGILLGIAGSDVPITELTKLTEQYMIGVNGYAFAITNNGYLIFHPNYKPTDSEYDKKPNSVKPNYNSIDLSQVEMSDDIQKLRTSMINRETGHLQMNINSHSDDMRRVMPRTQNYYFTDIEGTPFSLGIAIPTNYGMNRLKSKVKLKNADLDSLRASPMKLANWHYCDKGSNESSVDPLENLLRNIKDDDKFKNNCDKDLVEGLLYDAEATRGALANWMKQNKDGTMNESSSRRNGIEIVFLGTKSGLTRYYSLVENITEREFIEDNRDSIEENYYRNAVDNGEGIFTFSIPFDTGELDSINDTMMTVATPLVVTENGRSTVSAVVGLQMKYSTFSDMFTEVAAQAEMDCKRTDVSEGRDAKSRVDKNCKLTCESEDMDCYILDNNGFILYSENTDELGKVYGSLNDAASSLMDKLTLNESHINKRGIFQRVDLVDYQGMCDVKIPGLNSANKLLVDPIFKILSVAMSLAKTIYSEISTVIIQFLVLNVWSIPVYANQQQQQPPPVHREYVDQESVIADAGGGAGAGGGGEQVEDSFQQDYLDRLSRVIDEDVVDRWRNDRMQSPQLDYHSRAGWKDWFDKKIEKFGPKYKRVSCHKRKRLYSKAPLPTIPLSGSLIECEWCSRSYSAHRVPRTNLILLAIDATCFCAAYSTVSFSGGSPPPSSTPTTTSGSTVSPRIPDMDVTGSGFSGDFSNDNDTSLRCRLLRTELYRKRPTECYSYHAQEDSSECGAGTALYFNLLLVITSSALTLLYIR